jgi:rare lipoprotein A
VKILLILLLTVLLSNCTTVLNLSKYDKMDISIKSFKLIEPPYEINGKWFFPYDYKELNEIGTATRITILTNGNRTKNGEIFHNDVASASHRSLGLASNIRVTNLKNGYSMIVRANHRGSFSNTNIIELSQVVFKKLQLIENDNLVKIELISDNESFILNEAKTYNAEKKILSSAPIDDVSVSSIKETYTPEDLSEYNDGENSTIDFDGFMIEEANKEIEIYLHIATLSFKENAVAIKNNLNGLKNIKIIKTRFNEKSMYKVVVGPFKNMINLNRTLNNDTIQSYEDISIFIE